ncbi:flavodoxin family protein [Brassicibacter mesophilus]|uniref:flavodoxin family protein n=1 Tax=Brassicibacter mesophilus TaxID=745119 RepID=UPI003D1DF6A6
MKALILNGSLKEDESLEAVNKIIKEILCEKDYEFESILLHEKKIGECIGCFGCWTKTPGICVIDDYGRILTEKVINSDIVVYLTPVIYGGYSSELKKALDRIIPLLVIMAGKHRPNSLMYIKVYMQSLIRKCNKKCIKEF